MDPQQVSFVQHSEYISFECRSLGGDSSDPDRLDDLSEELPGEFADHRASRRGMVATACYRGSVIGVALATIYEHPQRPPALLALTAEVNEPFQDAGLERQLLEQLRKEATKRGFAMVFIDEDLQRFVGS